MCYKLEKKKIRKRITGTNKTIYIPDDIIAEIEKVAYENDLSFSNAVVTLVKNQLDAMRNRNTSEA